MNAVVGNSNCPLNITTLFSHDYFKEIAMKNLPMLLVLTACLSSCASAKKEVVHTDYGTLDSNDALYINAFEDCVGQFLELEATTPQEKAEMIKERNERTLRFTSLVSTVAMGSALKTDTDSVKYVNTCMESNGWQKY